jgi:hypothetical protein
MQAGKAELGAPDELSKIPEDYPASGTVSAANN